MGPEHTFNFNFTGVANATAVTIHLHCAPEGTSLASIADSLTRLVTQGDERGEAKTLAANVTAHAGALAAALPDQSA